MTTLVLKRAAQGATIVAGLVLTLTAWRSFRPSDVTPAAEAVLPPLAAAPAAIPTSDALIRQAVARDLFSPDRSASGGYRIGRAGEAPASAGRPAAELVALVGTVVAGDGKSFAMCQIGQETPQIVYVGGTVGSLTLTTVLQGSATFTDSTGKRVTLLVPKGDN